MKLIFLDIDGTLVEAGSNQPPESALMAIRQAQAAGHKVFLCSGRNYGMLKPLLVYGFDGYVSGAGGFVVCGEEVLFDMPLSPETAERTLEILHGTGVFCTVECRESTYCDASLDQLLEGLPEGNSELERWRKAINDELGILPLDQYQGEPIYKFVIMFRELEQLKPLQEEMGKIFDIVLQGDVCGVKNGELINRAYDKGRGVERICRYLDVPVEDTIGFGDSMNDITMMETVGISVCMGNGADELKARSDRVCPSVSEDGLAEAFLELGLTECS